jgi:hypothetical protein
MRLEVRMALVQVLERGVEELELHSQGSVKVLKNGQQSSILHLCSISKELIQTIV